MNRPSDPDSAENRPPGTRGLEELRDRVEFLERSLARLDRRLQNVESSIVFKFLRWLGPRLGVAPRRNSRPYAAWALETSFQQQWDRPRPETASPPRASISIFTDGRAAEPEKFAKTLQSIASQTHSQWELAIDAGPQPPQWMQDCLAAHAAGPPVRILSSARALPAGEYAAFIPAHAILEKTFLEDYVRAAESGSDAVYCDWDHIDPRGSRYAPRFTPENSPVLLHQTNYLGGCFLVRSAVLAALGWPDISVSELRTRLAENGRFVRIPRMLWHSQDSPPAIAQSVQNLTGAAPPVSVIICTRNPRQLKKSLQGLKTALNSRHEIIVIVHRRPGEADGLEQIAKRAGAHAIPYEGPFHFGEMNRLGVAASRHETICFLNDDVFPVEHLWLDRMAIRAATKHIGVVGALLLYPDRTIQHAGIAVGNWRQPAHLGRGQTDSPLWPWLRVTREVTAVTGACMLLRREIWNELGGFDPQFPVNYNDVDLCLRAAERGYRVVLEAAAVLIHEEARTRVAAVSPEESARFFERWKSVARAPDRFFNPQLACDDEAIELPPPWTAVR